jgi:hypothetical protein
MRALRWPTAVPRCDRDPGLLCSVPNADTQADTPVLTPPVRLVPQAGPAAWRGADLTPADWMLPIGAEEAAELEASLAAQPAAWPRLAALLHEVAQRLATGRGFVLLRGLPLARFEASGGVRAVLPRIGAELGTVLPQDAEGTMLVAHSADATAASTGDPMRFQSDPADAVLLLCLPGAGAEACLTLVSAPSLHNALLKADRAVLASLHEGVPQRRPQGGESLAVPVFSTASGSFLGRRDDDWIDHAALSPAQREALAALAVVAAEPGQALTLSMHPGDLLILNPLLVWRRAAAARLEGAGEGTSPLLRLWVSTPRARALPESFRPVFGDVARDAARGGAAADPPAVGG